MRRATLLAAAGALVAACSGDPAKVAIDLRTDYVPEREFVGISLYAIRLEAMQPHFVQDTIAFAGDHYERGIRLAEVPLVEQEHVIEVDLWAPITTPPSPGAFIEPLGFRAIRIDGEQPPALTIVITRSCEALFCPGSSPTDWQECHGGRCVEPSCSPELDETCGAPSCTADSDCASSVACVRAICESGVCMTVPRDDACPRAQLCDPTAGCVPES